MGSKVGKILKAVAVPAAAAWLGPAAGAAIAPGASAATQAAIGGGLVGGVGGGITGKGKLSNILTGAATGGLGGYAGAGGFGDIGGGITDALGLEGTAVGRFLGGSGAASGSSTPILTSSGGLAPLPSSGAALSGGGSSIFGGGGSLSNILSAGLGTSANDDAEEALLRAQNKAMGVYEPFANASFTPGDLTQDPGYQFNLAQGQQALDRAQAARGGYFSGNALKEAQQFGQGLADTTYNDAFQRWRSTQSDNLGVADRQAGIYGNQGDIQANAGVNNSNLLSSALSGILGGSGALTNTGSRQGLVDISGYPTDANGQVIMPQDGFPDDTQLSLLNPKKKQQFGSRIY